MFIYLCNQPISEGFATANSQGNLFNNDGSSQSIWSFPLGVSLSKSFSIPSSYNIKPIMDLTWTGNSGDVKGRNRSWIPDVVGSSVTESSIVDHSVFTGNLGVELSRGSLSYNLNYQLNQSSHNSDNGIQVGINYSF